MKTENEFNAYLSREFRKIKTLRVVKASDKYTPGISDFLLWSGGRGAFLETKFIRKLPRPSAQLLKHPFSSKQVSFLRSMTLIAGCPAWGAVAIKEEKKIVCFPSYHIPVEGNWRADEFLRLTSFLEEDYVRREEKPSIYGFDEIPELITDMFLETSKVIFDELIVDGLER